MPPVSSGSLPNATHFCPVGEITSTASADSRPAAASIGSSVELAAARCDPAAARGASGMAIESSGRRRFGGGSIAVEVLGLRRAVGSWLGATSSASGMGAESWTRGLRWPSGVHDEVVMRKMARARKGSVATRSRSGATPNSMSCEWTAVTCDVRVWACSRGDAAACRAGARVHRRSEELCHGRRSRDAPR